MPVNPNGETEGLAFPYPSPGPTPAAFASLGYTLGDFLLQPSNPVPPSDPAPHPIVTDADTEGDETESTSEAPCACCQETHPADALEQLASNGELRCGECRALCDSCDEWVSHDEVQWATNRRNREIAVCDSCRDAHYSFCHRCGNCVHEERLYYREAQDAHFCGACDPGEPDEDDEDSSSRVIRSYHSTRADVVPIPSPWSQTHGDRYFGVELEVEVRGGRDREEAAETLLDNIGTHRDEILVGRPVHGWPTLAGAESDGSLSYGFELVTAPLGMDDHRRLWPLALPASSLKNLASHNTDTCGLHVHMSRTGLTNVQIAKMVVFLNAPENEALILAVARRYDAGFCKAKQKDLNSAGQFSGDRYEMLNLANHHTVECRIFRGSLKPLAILAAVQFVNALADFCKDPRRSRLTQAAFVQFIAKPCRADDTDALRQYLTERNYTVTEDTLSLSDSFDTQEN